MRSIERKSRAGIVAGMELEEECAATRKGLASLLSIAMYLLCPWHLFAPLVPCNGQARELSVAHAELRTHD